MLNAVIKPLARFIPQSNRFQRIWKLAQVDFKRRYYNDKLGLVWALLNPLLRIATYYFIFKYVFQRGEENYGVFLFAGLLLWMFFAECTKGGLTVFRRKKYLLESIQLHKVDLFLSHVLSVSMGFMFNLCSFIVIAFISGIVPSWNILLLPLLVMILIMLGLGGALILGIVSLRLNDIGHAWDIIVLFGLWTAGIFFPAQEILKVAPWMNYIHPFIGLIENTRRITMYGQGMDWNFFTLNLTQGVVVCVLGFYLFDKYSHEVLERL